MPHHTTPHHTADTRACGSRVRDEERRRKKGIDWTRGGRGRERDESPALLTLTLLLALIREARRSPTTARRGGGEGERSSSRGIGGGTGRSKKSANRGHGFLSECRVIRGYSFSRVCDVVSPATAAMIIAPFREQRTHAPGGDYR